MNKDVRAWTQEWLSSRLVGLQATDDAVNAAITKVMSMEGDVDVNQRKNKVITIFDVKLQLEFSGQSFAVYQR